MELSHDDSIPADDLRRLVGRLRFRHLHMLVALQRLGSLRAAAAQMNLTQPALSKALAEVEEVFGHPLFERRARGLAVTARGEIVVRGASLLLAELARVGAEAMGPDAVTQLRVGAPPFVAQEYLPAVFARLLADDAPIRIKLHEDRVPALVQALHEGVLDALVTPLGADLDRGQVGSLRCEKLFEARFIVVAPAAHPLALVPRVSWRRLADEPWIMPARSSHVLRMLQDAFQRSGLVAPRPVMESTSPFTNLRMAAAGLGLAAVPESTWRNAHDRERVVRLRTVPALAPAVVALLSRATPAHPRVDLLRSALGIVQRQ